MPRSEAECRAGWRPYNVELLTLGCSPRLASGSPPLSLCLFKVAIYAKRAKGHGLRNVSTET